MPETSTFTAIDFETAQGYRWSICQIGLVRVENGKVTKELDILVQPPNNYYWEQFTDIHGLKAYDTAKAPTFDKVWHLIEPFIKGQTLVAHNGMAFDFPVLNKTLEYYNMAVPEYEKRCTYKLFKSNLANLCREYQIPLNHHDALSDAKACAELYRIHLKSEK